MRRRTECEALHDHLIPRLHPRTQQSQMHRRRPRRQRHHSFARRFPLPFWGGVRGEAVGEGWGGGHEFLQIFLKPIHIRSKGHHPVRIKRLLHIALFSTIL